MRKLLIVAFVAFFIAGCIEPPVQLGCCLKENISEGCVLYNLTDLTPRNLIAETNGPCNSSDIAYNTTGHCNVTLDGKGYLIPICTQDQIASCIYPDCVAMTCGDYVFKPRIAPGFTSTEESAGDIPPESEETANNFYKAQCRFLPMDVKLRNIMKNSKSLINVFRVGVGGSFDEYDQYRYYFPMSDQYCNVNPAYLPGDLRIDRYMNYLTAEGEVYNPEDIESNCLDDVAETNTGADTPFGFGDVVSGVPPPSIVLTPPRGSAVAIPGTPILPDESSYRFSRYTIVDYWASRAGGYYLYGDGSAPGVELYKKIDEKFYKNKLASYYVDVIFNETTPRAPFECASDANDCFSGACDTSIYRRATFIKQHDEGGEVTVVPSDCSVITKWNGRREVVCTLPLSASKDAGGNAHVNYADVEVQVAKVRTANYYYDQQHISDRDPEEWAPTSYNTDGSVDPESKGPCEPDGHNREFCALDRHYGNGLFGFWRGSFSGVTDYGFVTPVRAEPVVGENFIRIESLPENFSLEMKKRSECEGSMVTSGGPDDIIPCSVVTGGANDMTSPPLSQMVFFNTVTTVEYPETYIPGEGYSNYLNVIGYAIADPADFVNTEFYRMCSPNTRFVYLDGSPASDKSARIINSFRPVLSDVAEGLSGEFQGRTDDMDIDLRAAPNALAYYKGSSGSPYYLTDRLESASDPHPYVVSAEGINEFISRDPYGLYDNQGYRPLTPTNLHEIHHGDGGDFQYTILVPKTVILILDLGTCAMVDDKLPRMADYGWCKPCTTSTLAYQNITAKDEVYLPGYKIRMGMDWEENTESICSGDRYGAGWKDDVSCFNEHITDMDEYEGSLGWTGSPRTEPNAAIMKERLGDYMKSGVLPVLDLSDDSNWNRDNTYMGDCSAELAAYNACTAPLLAACGSPSDLFYDSCVQNAEMTCALERQGYDSCRNNQNFEQYDFERLFGSMGAAVVILDHVQGEADSAQVEKIVNRSNIIRSKCFGCLTAFHVDMELPALRSNFNRSINSVLVGPVEKAGIDLITFDYEVSEHLASLGGPDTVAWEIGEYGRTALQSKQKPVMVVGLNVDNNDGALGTPENYGPLFQSIIARQDELVRSGVVGIIYSPVRDTQDGSGKGLVNVDPGTGLGSKSAKFCAFQSAMETMTSVKPLALFTKTSTVSGVNCTRRSSLELSLNYFDLQSTKCDNGIKCTIPPEGPTDTWLWKCPDDTVVDECRLCNETGLQYTCTLTYRNGTIETIGPRQMSEIGSDLYMDIIGGLSKPDKCCLQSASGQRYTFSKQAIPTPINRPVVFSKSGDITADCGTGDPSSMTALSGFCGIQLPLKEYDINCSVG